MKESNWSELSAHVLAELKRLDKGHERIAKEISDMDERLQQKFLALHVDIATLKTKSSLWGATAGTIFGALISALVAMLFSKGS